MRWVSGLTSERDSSHMGCALSLALHVLPSQSPIDWGTPACSLSAARRTGPRVPQLSFVSVNSFPCTIALSSSGLRLEGPFPVEKETARPRRASNKHWQRPRTRVSGIGFTSGNFQSSRSRVGFRKQLSHSPLHVTEIPTNAANHTACRCDNTQNICSLGGGLCGAYLCYQHRASDAIRSIRQAGPKAKGPTVRWLAGDLGAVGCNVAHIRKRSGSLDCWTVLHQVSHLKITRAKKKKRRFSAPCGALLAGAELRSWASYVGEYD